MTRFFYSNEIVSNMGESNIYIILVIYIIYIRANFSQKIALIIPPKNTVFIKISYTLFSTGNTGNTGNKPVKPLVLQKSYVPTLPLFCSLCSLFPMCRSKLTVLFYKVFFEKPKPVTEIIQLAYKSICYEDVNHQPKPMTDNCQHKTEHYRQKHIDSG